MEHRDIIEISTPNGLSDSQRSLLDAMLQTMIANDAANGYSGVVRISRNHIVRKDELLQQLAVEMNATRDTMLYKVEVVTESGKLFEFPSGKFLDVLVSDIYWDERGSWADAIKVNLKLI